MKKRFCISIFISIFLLLIISPLLGVNIHHPCSHECNVNLSIAIKDDLINCKHTSTPCLDPCKKESPLEHLFENGILLIKSKTNYPKIKRKSIHLNLASNNYILFSDILVSQLITESIIFSKLYTISIQSSRAPPFYS